MEYRFIVSGHTHSPTGRDFAATEKRRKYLKQVYSQE